MKRIRRTRNNTSPAPAELPAGDLSVLQVCHPDWRGVRSSALAFGDPMVQARDLTDLIPLVGTMTARGTRTLVIQGWPPGAAALATAAAKADVEVLTLFHSSPAQHGVDGGEAEAVASMFALADDGVVSRVATVKAGVASAFSTIGHPVVHIPNRPPKLTGIQPTDVPDRINVGVFLHPMWRKNVTTQVLASLENGWTPYVMHDPGVPYLPQDSMVVCGEMSQDNFLRTEAAMDLTLNVTLSECHPMMPMESYRLGVPCLTSRTSDLFASDPDLYELTTVAEADNPSAIATAATRLLEHRVEVVESANAHLDQLDVEASAAWAAFTGR